jgi:hypothetical protein
MSPVLVTGGSSWVNTQLIATMLGAGRLRGGADDAGVEIVAANLSADDGWAAAVAGCEDIHCLRDLDLLEADQ